MLELGTSTAPVYVVHFWRVAVPHVETIAGRTVRPLTVRVVFGTGRERVVAELKRPG